MDDQMRRTSPHQSTEPSQAINLAAELALQAIADTERGSGFTHSGLPSAEARTVELLARMDGAALAANPQALGKLGELTKNSNPAVRRRAIQAFSRLDNEDLSAGVVAAIVGRLWDADAGVRGVAQQLLVRLDGRELAAFAAVFARHAGDPSLQVRQNAHAAIEMVNGFVLAKHTDRLSHAGSRPY